MTLSGTPTKPGVYQITLQPHGIYTDTSQNTRPVTSSALTYELDVAASDELTGFHLIQTRDGIPSEFDSPLHVFAGVPSSQTYRLAGGNGPYRLDNSTVNGVAFFVAGDRLTVSGTPAEAGDFSVELRLKDANGLTDDLTFRLHVELGFAPGNLPDENAVSNSLAFGIVGQPYRQVISAMGGTGQIYYTFQPTAGGLNLAVEGNDLILSGTPAVPGIYTFRVSARDGEAHRGSSEFRLAVVTSAPVLLVDTADGASSTSPNSVAPAQVGQFYTQTFTYSAGDSFNHDFKLWIKPKLNQGQQLDGLIVSGHDNTLTLSGTPQVAGSIGVLLGVEDASGVDIDSEGNQTVREPGMQSWLQEYTITVGPANPGLSLVSNGQPVPVATTDAPAVPRFTLPDAVQGLPYSQTLTAFNTSGGTLSFTSDRESYASSNGAEPSAGNLTLTQHGDCYVLSGTPAESGTFPIEVTAKLTDSSGKTNATVIQVYFLTVQPSTSLRLTREAMPPGMVGSPYLQVLQDAAKSVLEGGNRDSQTPFFLTASGGSGGYRFQATGLPPGMIVSSSGQVGGIPTVAGNYTVTVTVIDDAGSAASLDYPLSVVASPQVAVAQSSPLVAYSPDQIRQAYGFNNIILSGGIIGDGTGQTIIVRETSDARTMVSSVHKLRKSRPDQVSYEDSDLARYIAYYGLQPFGDIPGGDKPVFVKLDSHYGTDYPIAPAISQEQDFTPTYLPLPTSPNGEFIEDVIELHVLAPMANIVAIVDDGTNSNIEQDNMSFPYNLSIIPTSTLDALMGLPPVSVYSSSLNFPPSITSQLEDQQHFLPPFPETQPVTVVQAAGDEASFPLLEDGSPNDAYINADFPGESSSVVSVAMTQAHISTDGRLLGELGIDNVGGGVSNYIPRPAWQDGVVDRYSLQTRVSPDVGFLGSFYIGLAGLFDGSWRITTGSSDAAPAWAALFAIINQGRALLGQKPMNTVTDTLPALYSLPASDFHKVTQLDDGTNVPANYNASAGLGTPIANRLVAGMLGGHDTIKGKVRVSDDQGLAGWTLFLDANDNGTYEPGKEVATTTDSTGAYSFLVSPGSRYSVRVAFPTGSPLVQQSANPAKISFAPGSDLVREHVDFLFGLPSASSGPITPSKETSTRTETVPIGPRIVSVTRRGTPGQPARIVLTLDAELDPRSAGRVANYMVARLLGRPGQTPHRLTIRSARYDPRTRSITLQLRKAIPVHTTIMLRLKSGMSGGIVDLSGHPIRRENHEGKGPDITVVLSPAKSRVTP